MKRQQENKDRFQPFQINVTGISVAGIRKKMEAFVILYGFAPRLEFKGKWKVFDRRWDDDDEYLDMNLIYESSGLKVEKITDQWITISFYSWDDARKKSGKITEKIRPFKRTSKYGGDSYLKFCQYYSGSVEAYSPDLAARKTESLLCKYP